MNEMKKAYNREKSVNQFLLIIITIMDLFLFFGYFSDYSKGNIGLGFLLAVELTVLISMIADYAGDTFIVCLFLSGKQFPNV